jgi:hypothetical protein
MQSKPLTIATRFFLVVLVTFVLVVPGVLGDPRSLTTTVSTEEKIVSKLTKDIEIPPGSDYYIKFDSQNLTLKGQEIIPYIDGLSDTVIAAIAKSPHWIQQALTRQFHNLSDPESYAEMLLNASKQCTDEVAFTVACCPGGKVPPANIVKENAEALYEHDQWIQYADIIDYDNGTGNYYSTIRYRVLENGTEKQFELPPEIYYWYIVHPKISMADIDTTYGPLWRDYLFEHSDLGYPLLKEKLSTVKYLWDCTSYYQNQYRLWTSSIAQHPTAIEAVSYWIGKTVPYPAVGDRPGKPCVIAHEHNGWCGELQVIAVAAQRTALIPSVGASNVGEDHVWREFFERGWHENDNWWSDTGGAVDEPDAYGYGWKKNMSAIYQWRGDDTISDDTARYIHPQDRITVTFTVKDTFLQPVDGARVTVLVKGPKDITYYKNLIWGKIQAVWDKLPEFLKGKILSFLFDKLKGRYDAIPGEVNGVTITTWNYTDLDGRCSFQLGKNLEYLFLIQAGNLKKPWQLARHNLLRNLDTHADKEFRVILFDVSHRPQRSLHRVLPSGDCRFTLSFTSTAYQVQNNFYTDGSGSQEVPGEIDCFFVDTQNFALCKAGRPFTCFNSIEAEHALLTVSAKLQDWYLVFRNHGRVTNAQVSISLQVELPTDVPRVQIVTPNTSLFALPTFTVGDIVTVSGIATDQVYLTIGCNTHEVTPVDGIWTYYWNTSGVMPGRSYHIGATCGEAYDDTTVLLQDSIPPHVEITTPISGSIVGRIVLNISGQSSDNVGIDHVEVRVDNNTWRTANGTASWASSWDLGGLSLGDHTISARAIDEQGAESTQTIPFVINESGHSWGPQIEQVYHLPEHPVNTSNVIVYANVSTGSPFALDHIILYCANGTDTTAYEMYRYGDHPVQGRHEEDPLRNLSNAPLYGRELGQFPEGTTISYWIVAVDTAQNTKQSDVSSFTIS